MNVKAAENKMNSDEITRLRTQAYNAYSRLLRSETPLDLFFPVFNENGNFVQWSGDIEDDGIQGRSYLLGEVVRQRRVGYRKTLCRGIVIDSQYGIRLFENYFERKFRPMVIAKEGDALIADINEFKRQAEKGKLDRRQIGDMIEANFMQFPYLVHCFRTLPKEDYDKVYADSCLKHGLFF